MLIVNSDYPADRKSILMRNLLNPLMEKFKILLEKLIVEQDEERQTVLADCLNHAVGFARYVPLAGILACVSLWRTNFTGTCFIYLNNIGP